MGELLPRRTRCTLGSLQDKEEFPKWSTEQVCVEEDGARKGEHSPSSGNTPQGTCCLLGDSFLQVRSLCPPQRNQMLVPRTVNINILQFCLQACCSFIHPA